MLNFNEIRKKNLNKWIILFFLILAFNQRLIFCNPALNFFNKNVFGSKIGFTGLIAMLVVSSFHNKKIELLNNLLNISFNSIFGSEDNNNIVPSKNNKNIVSVENNKKPKLNIENNVKYSYFERFVNFSLKFLIKTFSQKKVIGPALIYFYFRKQIGSFISDDLFGSPYLKSIFPNFLKNKFIALPGFFTVLAAHSIFKLKSKISSIREIFSLLSNSKGILQNLKNFSFYDLAEKILSSSEKATALINSWASALKDKKAEEKQKVIQKISNNLANDFKNEQEEIHGKASNLAKGFENEQEEINEKASNLAKDFEKYQQKKDFNQKEQVIELQRNFQSYQKKVVDESDSWEVEFNNTLKDFINYNQEEEMNKEWKSLNN